MEASGINLSAFAASRRPLVAIARTGRENDVNIELHPAAMFGRSKLSDGVAETFAGWGAGLLELPRPIAVDVALSAPEPAKPALLWELNFRPIDFAFYGDAPLTDKIGEFGARFRAMLADGAFGNDIVEASPRATVELFEFKGHYAGGAAHHGRNGWKPDDRNHRGDKVMAKLLEELGVNPSAGAEKLDSEDLDAILCALTALAVQRNEALLAGKALDREVADRCARRANAAINPAHAAPASSAVLAQPFWETLNVRRA
jgi:hypothetical protein